MTKEPYWASSEQDTARKRNAGKTRSLGGLLESWVRFYRSKQLSRLAWDQQSVLIHIFFIILLWCWNEIKCVWSKRNTDEIPALVYVVVKQTCLLSWVLTCGHCAHLMCTVTAELLERALLILFDWWNAVVLVCKSVSAEIFIWTRIAHIGVNLCVSMPLYVLTFPLFLCPLAVLWWAVRTQMWASRIWFLTSCWGEWSRARRGRANGYSTLHFYWQSQVRV